jgi:cytochrome b561
MPFDMRRGLQPEIARYRASAQLLHWLTALLLPGSFALGFYMVGLDVSPDKLRLYAYHKWIGVTVFAVALLRLGWRLWSPPPALPASMPAWERQASSTVHRLLYLLVLAVPLSGWLMSSAKGFQTVYFALLPIPDALAKNAALGAALEEVHWALNKMLLLTVCLHIAAALKHHYIDRDGILLRMLPRRTRPETRPEDRP